MDGLNCVLRNSYAEDPVPPNMALFGDRAFEKGINLTGGH